MLSTTVYPLRTVVGDPVIPRDPEDTKYPEQYFDVRVIEESPICREIGMRYDYTISRTIHETVEPSGAFSYLDYLPVREDASGNDLNPGSGMGSLPVPPERPFADNAPVLSLFALSKSKVDQNMSRNLHVKLLIQWAHPELVGGVCFGGHPFLPYTIDDSGENAANFGLPREISLSPRQQNTADLLPTAGFLDADVVVTRQEICSHSGFHYLLTNPTRTNRIVLRLADFPWFFVKAEGGGANAVVAAPRRGGRYRFGYVMPYFYIFRYREGARYRPNVPFGLLGATTDKAPETDVPSPAGPAEPETSNLGDAARIELDIQAEDNSSYYSFTAASMVTQGRSFHVPHGDSSPIIGQSHQTYRESFISDLLPPKRSITLVLQQGEEYPRCIAGIRMLLPFWPEVNLAEDLEAAANALQALLPGADSSFVSNLPREQVEAGLRQAIRIPGNVDFCEKMRFVVYEIDPVEGISPLQVVADSKYAHVLADCNIDELHENFPNAVIRFRRPTLARYLGVTIVNTDEEPGQVVIPLMRFIQSAHVSIHSRAAVNQRVLAFKFRIVGPSLAEDYAVLGGREGFSFSVERIAAGQRKSQLLKVNSLLDLLHDGTARLFSNTRQRATEEQVGQIKNLDPDDNYEKRSGSTSSYAWRRSEAGRNSDARWQGRPEHAPEGDFEVYHNQETRTHSQFVVPHRSPPEPDSGDSVDGHWHSSASFINALYRMRHDTTASLVPLPPAENALYEGFREIWKGVRDSEIRVSGLKSVSASPYGWSYDEVEELVNAIARYAPNFDLNLAVLLPGAQLAQLIAGLPEHLRASFAIPYRTNYCLLNGLRIGLGIQPFGLGMNFSGNGLLLPSFQYQDTFGSQGVIVKQAGCTGYSYAQYLQDSCDESKTETYITAGKSRRIIRRAEVEGTDRDRLRGAEVMWQDKIVDIVTGTQPLDLAISAYSERRLQHTADEYIQIRISGGTMENLTFDFWFDVLEEAITDDY